MDVISWFWHPVALYIGFLGLSFLGVVGIVAFILVQVLRSKGSPAPLLPSGDEQLRGGRSGPAGLPPAYEYPAPPMPSPAPLAAGRLPTLVPGSAHTAPPRPPVSPVPPQAPPPGWYASGIRRVARWWDGSSWTSHLSYRGAPTTVEKVQRAQRITQIGWGSLAAAVAVFGLVLSLMDGFSLSAALYTWWSPLIIGGGAALSIIATTRIGRLRMGPSRFDPLV